MTVAAGFFIIGTPGQARLYRFDEQKVQDLQNIQYQVVYYWQQKQKLPATLADLEDPISGFMVPVDAQTGQAYPYKPTGALSFQLCAVFNAETRVNYGANNRTMAVPAPIGGKPGVIDNWQHSVGETCFDRTIDPERYPPTPKVRP